MRSDAFGDASTGLARLVTKAVTQFAERPGACGAAFCGAMPRPSQYGRLAACEAGWAAAGAAAAVGNVTLMPCAAGVARKPRSQSLQSC